MSSNFNWRAVAVAVVLLMGVATVANAQQVTGNVFVTVTDTANEVLPGVRVTISGNGAPQTQFTDAQGQARFLGLSPGQYQLGAELQGFSPVEVSSVTVNVGRNTSLDLKMTPAVEETITVTSESPLLDERKISTGSTVTQVELEKIPTARDPWVILQSVPGVLVDRVNVGGNESGQQSNFTGPGAASNQASWSVDGVVITDPAARGSSPTYYNFDAFEEMSISTGGSDTSAMTGGVQLNLVTKRGTNQWRAEGRYLVTDQEFQSDSSLGNGDFANAGPWNNTFVTRPAGTAPTATPHGQSSFAALASTESVDDYGFELGGPIVKDRLWIWGTYGVQDVTAFLGTTPDNTELESYAAKINAQFSASNSAVVFYHFGDKVKNGRGAAVDRPVETTWNQSGPTDIYKLEDTQIFNSNLYLTGSVSYVGGGFELIPIGGEGSSAPNTVRDTGRIWRHSFFGYHTERPQEQAKLDGSYFFNTGAVNHELKFGVGYRNSEVSSTSTYSGNGVVGRADLGAGYGDGTQYLAVVYHDILVNDSFEVWSAQLQDTITWGNMTLNAGFRYDIQTPESGNVTEPASLFAPNLITSFTRQGGEQAFEWKSISPRLGITYAIGEERDTLIRGSYARFVDQLGTGFFANLGVKLNQYAYTYWSDNDGDQFIDAGELDPAFGLVGDRTIRANQFDPDLDPAETDELLLGVEHALLPEFVVGLQATYRQTGNTTSSDILVSENGGAARAVVTSDYVLAGTIKGTLPNGQTFSEPVYKLKSGVTRAQGNGTILRNRGTDDEYLGLSATFNKRLSNRWMLRGFVNYSDWQNVVDPGIIEDPTRTVNSEDGSQVLTQSAGSGSKSEIWINSTWSANISGMYQVAPDRPWGFNVSADVNAREGYAIPYRVAVAATSRLLGNQQLGRTVLVSPEGDSFRNDDLFLVNLRVEKEFSFGDFGLTVGVDAFNVFNTSTVLQRGGLIAASHFDTAGNPTGQGSSAGTGDHVLDNVAPRIFRLGARISWN
jgi:hypothetical protein